MTNENNEINVEMDEKGNVSHEMILPEDQKVKLHRVLVNPVLTIVHPVTGQTIRHMELGYMPVFLDYYSVKELIDNFLVMNCKVIAIPTIYKDGKVIGDMELKEQSGTVEQFTTENFQKQFAALKERTESYKKVE